MGLDMYLYKKTNVSEEYSHVGIETDIKVIKKTEDGEVEFKFGKISTITERLLYWRKANHIHGWFSRKLGGVGNYKPVEVNPDLLVELYDDCVRATITKDESIFEPTEGFFFGAATIDEWYWDDLLRTIRLIKPEVEKIKELEKHTDYSNFPKELLQQLEVSYEYVADW
jgi:hypothetical protein